MKMDFFSPTIRLQQVAVLIFKLNNSCMMKHLIDPDLFLFFVNFPLNAVYCLRTSDGGLSSWKIISLERCFITHRPYKYGSCRKWTSLPTLPSKFSRQVVGSFFPGWNISFVFLFNSD